MTAIRTQRQNNEGTIEEAEIREAQGRDNPVREFVRRDQTREQAREPAREPAWPRSRPDTADAAVTSANTLIDRVAGASVVEIERAIRELELMRERIKTEGDRVQREISHYANLSQSAMVSLRTINDSLAQLQPTQAHD